MPVKSSTPVTVKKAPTPRKRRTKKTQTDRVIKQVQKVLDKPSVTVTSFKGGKVVKKVTTLKRPSTARLITADRYLKDIRTRWAIHNFEIQELIKDLSKGFQAVKPYHTKLVNLVK